MNVEADCRDDKSLFVTPPGHPVITAPVPGQHASAPIQPAPPMHHPTDLQPRLKDPYDVRPAPDYSFPTWDPPRTHPHAHPESYGSRPPPPYFHDPYERYPPTPRRFPEASWRPRVKKRRESVPPSADRSRHRPVHERVGDHQREAAENRVRQQLQGVHVMEELCSKESYQRYLKLTGDKPQDIDQPDAPSSSCEAPPPQRKTASECVDMVLESMREIEERRSRARCVRTHNSSIMLTPEQAEVLRTFYSSTTTP